MSCPGSKTISRRRLAAVAAVLIAAGACASDSEEPRREASPTGTAPTAASTAEGFALEEFGVPAGSRPHDVAPARDGGVWYTAQSTGELGHLDPKTKKTGHVDLGSGSSPHGVIVGPDGAAWVTDTGRNAILRVDPDDDEVTVYESPRSGVGMHTATFTGDVMWFTGNAGFFGRLDTSASRPEVEVFEAPGGAGPYGITATPDGDIFYASLQGSHIARVDTETGEAERIDPPTPNQGARRAWSDSDGRIWVTYWEAGKLGRYDPADDAWKEYDIPGENPMPYSVFVDDDDVVWVSDFGANAFQRFDPGTERFTTIEIPSGGADVRQMLGRPGEMWGAESGTDKLVVIRTG